MTTQYFNVGLNRYKYTKSPQHKHEKNEKHQFDFNSTKILIRDDNCYKFSIKEIVHIFILKTAGFSN